MSSQGEPEKYSIDEMMERLKNASTGDPNQDGELVTRSDGSQAIRVRKRKRRSHQPHKEVRQHSLRARMVQVSAALILLLLVLFAAGAAIIYANSSAFKDSLVQKISLSSGADATIEEYRMNPTAVNARSLTLKWPEGNVMRDIFLRGIKAEISLSSFLGKSMTGDEISANEGTLSLSIPQMDKPARVSPPSTEALPVRFSHYSCPKFSLLFGDPEAPLASILKSEASFQPVNPTGRAQLLLNHGEVYLPGWPNLKLDRAHAEFQGSDVDILSLRLQAESDPRGVFELSGTLSPYSMDHPSTLAVRLESYPMAGIVGPQLGRLFSGRLDTSSSAKSNYLTIVASPSPECTMAVGFHGSIGSPMEMNAFPCLGMIARILDDSWYEQPTFEDSAKGMLRRAGGNIVLTELDFENKSRMAVRGMLTLAPNQSLTGNLEIGLPEAMIKASKNSRLDSMCGPPKDGFRWINLKITGSGGAPSDNFKDLYAAAANTTPPSSSVPSFEQLTPQK